MKITPKSITEGVSHKKGRCQTSEVGNAHTDREHRQHDTPIPNNPKKREGGIGIPYDGAPFSSPPDFFSKKNVTKILFKLEVVGFIPTKSRKLGVPRAHPTCAEISVSKFFFLVCWKVLNISVRIAGFTNENGHKNFIQLLKETTCLTPKLESPVNENSSF